MKDTHYSKAAMFWDESYFWGLMSYRSFRSLGLKFDLLRAVDIKSGALSNYDLLYVPGGWASNKKKALGETGIEKIKQFIKSGGNYFGICGGAGLATKSELDLVEVNRKSMKERVPSLNGRVRVTLNDHPVWHGIVDPVFFVWWPSQFISNSRNISELAKFNNAEPDAFSSDLRISDINLPELVEYESIYGINLNPDMMSGDPVVLEGKYGKGTVLISLLHFDSPGDLNGGIVLKNIWEYFNIEFTRSAIAENKISDNLPVSELFDFGKRNFLWTDRSPLINWRRGIRGFEYYTLYELYQELVSYTGMNNNGEMKSLNDLISFFCEKAKQLLMYERLALHKGESITFACSSNPKIVSLRKELFSEGKSYGGLFKEILDQLDSLLYTELKNNV